ncbi:MAG: tail fiber domain-containing protein, partial [Alphaproteobacteria bacterium]
YGNAGLNYFGGNVGINVAVSTTKPLLVGSTSSNGNGAYLDATGVWVNASDRRIKENIKPIQYGLDSVMKLKPVAYDMKGTHAKQVGFIAQDVLKVVPEVVGVPKDAEKEHYGLSYGNMVAVTVKAIQELKADNDNLRQQVVSLKKSGTGGSKDQISSDAVISQPSHLLLLINGGLMLIVVVLGGVVLSINRDMRKLRKQLKKAG